MSPIVIAFTVTAAIAVLLHSYYLGRVYGDWRALDRSGQNGALRRTARTFVQVEFTRFCMNLCVLIAGLGIILGLLYQQYPLLSEGFKALAYLLAAIPVISSAATIIALRGFD